MRRTKKHTRPKASKRVRDRNLRRASLSHGIFELALAATESFAEDEIGVDLAYLLGAILKPSETGCVDWTPEHHPKPPALLEILRKRLPVRHAVWKYILTDNRP